MAPSKPPAALQSQSTCEGTRTGKKLCKLSKLNDKLLVNTHAKARADQRAWPVRSAAKQSQKPKGT
jgi:hypothetical protein